MFSVLYRVIETLVKVWENSKKLWKHLPAARVLTAFLVLPNFHSCFFDRNTVHVSYFLISNVDSFTCKKLSYFEHEVLHIRETCNPI